MQKLSKFFSELVNRHSKLIILTTLGATVFFGYGLTKLKMASEFTDDLPANDPIIQTQKYFQDVFGKKDFIIVGIENNQTIYNPVTLEKVKKISEELKHIPGVIEEEVISLSTANNIKGRDWGLEVGVFMKNIPQTEKELSQLKKDVEGNDLFYGRLVSKDETLTTIIVGTKQLFASDLDNFVEKVYEIAGRHEGPEKLYFVGDPIGSYEIDRGIQHDINFLIPFAFLLILLDFYLSFRTLRGILIPSLLMVVSIIWTMGLMGLLGYEVNVVTSVIPVVMLAITSSYGIHIVYRYYELSPQMKNSLQAASAAVGRTSQPLLMAGITSAVGSVTLMVFRVISIKEFGIFLSAGIFFGFMLALTFIPAVLSLLKFQVNNINQDKPIKKDLFDRLIPKLTDFVMSHRKFLLVLVGLVFIISLAGVSLVKVGINFVDFFPKEHKFILAANKLSAKAGGTNPLVIMVETREPDGIKKPEILQQMLELENYARTLKHVGSTDSFARLIKRMHFVMNGEKPEFNTIPDSSDLVAQYLLLYSISGNPGDFDNLVDYDYRRAKVTINLTTFDQEEQKVIFEKIQNYVDLHFPKDVKIAYDGLIYWIAQTNYVVKGKIENIISSILIVFLFCTAVYGSFRFGILSIISLTVVTIFTFGIMGFAGIRLNMATAIITSIAVGVGVDFAIHYLTHFREQINKGLDYREATMTTMVSTGKIIIFDGLSNVLGFIAFVFSGFVPIQNLGWLLSLNMITVSMGSLIVLPVLLGYVNIKTLTENFKLTRPSFPFPVGEGIMGRGIGGVKIMFSKTIFRNTIVIIGLILWFLFTFNSAFSADLSARGIMEKNDEIQTSKDNRSKITMKLINEKGQERVRKIFYWDKRDADKNQNTLIKFQFPADVKGSGLLTLEHKNSEDDQWLYLPALRKTRRISANDKGDSFMGSDFTFEDMEMDTLNDFDYKLIAEENINGDACYQIEGIPIKGLKKKTNYSRREIWIRKNDFALLKIKYYDMKGDYTKTLTASEIKIITEKPRAHKVVMENPRKKHKTELIYEEIALDQGLADNLFTERELVRQ